MKHNIKSNINIVRKLDLSSEIIRKLDIDDTDIDGEKVMMNIDKGKYYTMNRVASRIWELSEEKIKIKEIVNVLTNEYEVTEEICMNSTINFLERLYDEKLIDIV